MILRLQEPRLKDEFKGRIGGRYGEPMKLDTSKESTLDTAITASNTALELRGWHFRAGRAAEAIAAIFGHAKEAS